ncbi:unnamed protein product [Larinioides sclopetarius]|uniref:Nose resistant-to-fluoxetine protein N-terminal domain-containing protein n=1 Tax=Larinioides sclopetarius TaxID=280406 RepID=A0AAV2BW76_9ARAC
MNYISIYLKTLCFLVMVGTLSCTSYVGSSSYAQDNATKSTTPIPNREEDPSIPKWKAAEKALKKIVGMIVKNSLPAIMQASETLNLTTGCSKGLFKLFADFKQTKLWAFRMIDSSGKIPNGIIDGSINSFGDYDMCVNTEVPRHFRGQYCLVELDPPLPPRRPFVSYDEEIPQFINVSRPDTVIGAFLRNAMYFHHLNFRSSVCVPSTCSREEIQAIATKVLEMIGIDFKVLVAHCETKVDKITFSSNEIVIMTVLALLLTLAVIATVVDVILKLKFDEEPYQDRLTLPVKYLLCFSLYTNTSRLLKKDTSPNSIKVIHGMKVITCLWVILNHTYYYVNYQAFSSLLNAREISREVGMQIVYNAYLNVETFFFISAVLLSYGVMKSKELKLNVLRYIFKRFWRLTPPFMLLISCVYLLPHLGSGPVWKETVVDGLTEKCKKYWWTNLLYINNFVPSAETCLNWTWYIPVDTHLYFLSLFVLIPLKSNPRLTFMLNGLLFAVGTAVTAALHIYFGLQPTAISAYLHPDDINYFLDRGYFRTYIHCGSYCVGLTVGYILATKQKLHIPLRLNIVGWIVAFAAGLTVLYGVHDWNQGNVPGIVVSTLYMCTSKLIWSLALAWVTVTCMTGNGGIVKTILSWEAFVPLSRLTYMAYLVQPIVQFLYIGSARNPITSEHRTFVFMYLANVMFGFMIAFGLSLLFEFPFMAMERLMFSSRRSRVDAVKNNNIKKIKTVDSDMYTSSTLKEDGICTVNIRHTECSY